MTPPKKWDGHERRIDERRENWKPKCALHDIVNDGLKDDIKDIKDEVRAVQKSIVGRWAFNAMLGLIIPIMVFVGYGILSINHDIDVIQKSMFVSQKNISLIMESMNLKELK